MSYYLIRYSLIDDKAYEYPPNIAGVAWKSVVYSYTEEVMVGETDATVEVDGKQITSLTPTEAQKLMEEYQASYPKPDDSPGNLTFAEL